MGPSDVARYTLPPSYAGYNRPFSPSNPYGYLSEEVFSRLGYSAAKRLETLSNRRESIDPSYHSRKEAERNAAYAKAHPKSWLSRAASSAASLGGDVLSTAGKYAGSVPGIGTAVGAAANAVSAVAQGKSLTEIGKAAARGAIPGGPLVQAAASAALNVAEAGVRGKKLARAARDEVVNAAVSLAPPIVQGTLRDTVRAGLSGQNIASAAQAAVVAEALNQVPDPTARELLKKVAQGHTDPASLLAAAPGHLLGAVVANSPAGALASSIHSTAQTLTQKAEAMRPNFGLPLPQRAPEMRSAARVPFGTPRPLLPQTRPSVLRRGVPYQAMSDRARAFLRLIPGMPNTGDLQSDGTWLVKAGDTGSKIAKALTGDANRWTELKAVNPKIMSRPTADIKKYGFPIYVNDRVYLPSSWVQAKPAPAPTPTAVPQAPIPTAPAGDLAAMAAVRMQLVAWAATDGKDKAGATDYGGIGDMTAATWTSRDVFQAASFEQWWNKSGFSPMPVDGAFTAQLANNLRTWTEKKAQVVVPQPSPVPTPPVIVPQPSTPPAAPTSAPSAAPAPPAPTPQQVITNQLPALISQLPQAITNLPAVLNPPATAPAAPPPAPVEPAPVATNYPPTASTPTPAPKPPMSPQTKGLIMTAAGVLGTIIGPGISRAMFGSSNAPPMPI